MIERRVVDKATLIKKLNSMTYEYITEQQMNCLFTTIGHTIQVEEEGDDDCNTN